MSISTFNRQACKDIDRRVREALAPLAEELGVKITPKGGRFDDTEFTMKLSFEAQSEAAEQKKAEAFGLDAAMFGVPSDALGKRIMVRGRVFTVTGIRTRARTRPVEVVAEDNGKTYCMDARSVITRLKAPVA